MYFSLHYFLTFFKDSCGDNEVFTERMFLGKCDANTCLTFSCSELNRYRSASTKWGPHCDCSSQYLRLKNGTFVPSCVAKYQPSPGNNFINNKYSIQLDKIF